MTTVYLKQILHDPEQTVPTVWAQCEKDDEGATKFEATSKLIWELGLALMQCRRMFDEALPKFDWTKANLDANAIQLLNETPGVVARALKLIEEEQS
jgi:hypothetical protein